MNADVALIDAAWTLSDKSEIFLNASYAVTDAAFESLRMAEANDVPMELFPSGLPGPGEPDDGPMNTKDYDFGAVHEYTDLDYTELRATLGLRYKVRDDMTLFGSLSIYDLNDDEPYYQDELGELVDPGTDHVTVWDTTGSVAIVSGGLSWIF